MSGPLIVSSPPGGGGGGGVTQIQAGTGISIAPAGGTGVVTITNAGVTSAVAGTGISVSGATGAVTFTNTGVTSIVAGSGITVSGATGAVTVTNAWGAYPLTATGDLVYANAASTNTRLAIGAEDLCLTVAAGVPVWEASATSTLTTTGDLLYASAANTLARLAVGSGTQLLGVSGGIPAWVAAPAAGNFTLISDQTLGSAVASVTFSSIPGTYKHLVLFMSVQPSSAGPAVQIQFNGDTGTNYARAQVRQAGVSDVFANSVSAANIVIDSSAGGASVGLLASTMFIPKYADTSFKTKIINAFSGFVAVDSAATAPTNEITTGSWTSSVGTAITSIKIQVAAGNFNIGSEFSLYGLN